MRRFTYLFLASALILTGAAYAQGPTTSAPTGSSLQREPQPANNDLRNPGNPQDQTGSATTTTTTTPTTTNTDTGTQTDTTTTTTTTPSSTTDTTTSSTTTSTTPSTDTTTSSTTTSSTLPRTGSEMPLVGLIGFLALASALGLKAYEKRNA
jgi:LPXTG-motif cell wall-anchored protein